jgi:DNA-binding transcriptional LysR family regulator
LIIKIFIIYKIDDWSEPMPRPLVNLDLDLVRSFVTIAQLRHFTRAASRLGRQQSTITLQVQRLEQVLGFKLLERTPRAVLLTAAGEEFLHAAQRLLDLNDEIIAQSTEPDMRGVVRLGTPEDFATSHLPDVLSRFAHAYPAVSLEVTCDLTLHLIKNFKAGAFDLTLIKREKSVDTHGTRVWREPLVWVGDGRMDLTKKSIIPLVVSPAPCVYRKRAIDALERSQMRWRVAYTCASLAGSVAAVKAGLGITVLPKGMMTQDIQVLQSKTLPHLRDTEIALLHADNLSVPAQRLRQHIIHSLG